MDTATLTFGGVTITVSPSGGTDGALVIFVDTLFEPDGSDGGPGLRVLVNDDDAYIGVPFEHEDVPDCGDPGPDCNEHAGRCD